MSHTAPVEAALSPPTVDACPASGDPPIDPGSTRTHPGHWHNPKRSGTGWDFFYFGNTQMMGFWYAYERNGAPIWYRTSLITIDSATQTWTGTLHKATLSQTAGVQEVQVGEISGRLYPGSATRMGLRWTLPTFSNPPQECVYDIYREAPINLVEATPAHSGNWYDALHSGWGYLYSMGRLSATLFNEAEKLLLYDVEGSPVWLIALTNHSSEPGNSTNGSRGLTYSTLRSPHRIDTDCTDDPATVNVNECITAWTGYASFSRTFTSPTTATISVSANVPAGLGGTVPNRALLWPNPDFVFPQSSTAQTYPATLTKVTQVAHVFVDNSYCEAPNAVSTCGVYVGWASDNSIDRVYRYNLITGARTEYSSASSGSKVDNLPPGSRVRYELRRGSPIAMLVSSSADVLVSVGGGNPATTPPDVPPAPAAFQEPVLDEASDRVGALAANFKVNEGGSATYSVPLYAPRGAGGFTPEVSLSYASAGGEGLLGTGFNLNAASSIQKCRSGKEFGDGDLVSSNLDQLCLDGQRLLLWKGTHLSAGAEYRTEIDSFQRIVLTSTPSIPASNHGLSQAVPTYAFTVYGKDGSVRRFGDIGGSVVAPIGFNRGAAVAWLQTEGNDASGNTLQFSYSSQGSGALSMPGERTLDRISYAGGALNFNYIASGRRDISHSNIGDAYASRLLRSVTVYGAENQVLRHYAVGYTNLLVGGLQLVRPRVTSLRECADTAEQICYPATTFAWNDVSGVADNGNSDNTLGKRFPNLISHRLGDFNGDGRTDIVWADQGGRVNVLYAESNANGIAFSPNSEVVRISRVDPAGAFQSFDIDADGYDDLIYLTESATIPNRVAWYLRRSTGTGFAAAELLLDNVGPADSSETLKYESSLVDHTGDGLPDLVFRIGMDSNWIAIMQRDPGNADRPFSFLAPLRVRLVDPSGLNTCAASTYTPRRDQERAQVVDVDGDGRSDLSFMSTSSACATGTPIVTGGAVNAEGAPLEPIQPVAEEGPETPYGTDVAYYAVSYRAEGIVAGAGGAQEFRFTRAGRTVRVIEQHSPTSSSRARQRVMAADLNADGYMDYVYLADNGQWRFNLTVADSVYGYDQCVASCLDATHTDKVQLIDYDGDSKLDFWWPDSSTTNRNYKIYLWKGDGFASSAISTDFIATAGNDWVRMPADYDGDGLVDNLVAKPVDNGSADGGWSVRRSINHHQPRAVVTSIVNGLGARTEITYSPLTFSSVYRRDYDGPLRTWGRGSAVFDVAMPAFVVQYVSSSAPTAANPLNQAIVQYQYRGLKLQAGGRGSLGFGRVSTTDLQTQVSVDTYILNEFPMTGLPLQTRTRKLTAIPADSCRNSSGGFVENAACFSRTAICPYGKLQICDSSLPEPSAVTVKSLSDTYGWRYQPVGPAADGVGLPLHYYNQSMASVPPPTTKLVPPIFVARILTNVMDYDPVTAKQTRFVAVLFSAEGYDGVGNVLRSTTTTRRRLVNDPVDDTIVQTEVRNTYADDVASWKLGRLVSTLTFTRREERRGGPGVPVTLGRKATFTYSDPLNPGDTRRLLHSERVEGMLGSSVDALSVDTATRGTVTYYEHDAAGNRTGAFTCSADISENACRSGAGSGSYVFHPADSRVMRYTRTTYDALQRYVASVREAVSAGADAATEATMSTVLSRNGGGDVLEAQDENGKLTRVRYGRFGRKRFAYDQTGASVRTDWAACSSNCPSGMALAFVETTTTTGAPTTRVFHDLLGRPVISLRDGFNAGDYIATVTRYDTRGNVTEVSQPFFATNATSGAATPKPNQTLTWTVTSYDFLNRPYQIVAPDNGVTRKDYYPSRTVTTLPANASGMVQTVTEDFTPQGEVMSTTDAKGLTIKFSYDAGGQLLRAERNGRTTSGTFDTLGRKLSTSDPDIGTWTYVSNDAGESIAQTSPRGHCTQQRYDGRGRVWQRTDYLGACGSGTVTASATFQFDTAPNGRGKLASAQATESGSVSVSRYYAYNSLGQPIEMRTDQGGRSYFEQHTFDNYGRAFQNFFTAPGVPTSGERTEYNERGYAFRVRSAYPASTGAIYYEAQEFDALGKVRRERMAIGAELATVREFDVLGRLKRQRVQGGGIPDAQDIGYDYDQAGNMRWRESVRNGVTLRETFGYDELQRLLSSNVQQNGSAIGSVAQSYDGEGNVLTKGGTSYTYAGTTAGRCATEPGAVAPGPHAVSRAGSTDYCYDASGNVIRVANGGDERIFSYTSYDKAVSIRSNTNNTRTDFNYGPGREKVRRLDFATASATNPSALTEFVSGAEIRIVNNAIDEVLRYVGPVMIKQRRVGTNYDLVRQYRIEDGQGSTDAVLDIWAGAVNASARMSFDPFGQRRNAANWIGAMPWNGTLRTELDQTTRRGYTGHEQAEEVGIVHMNGRIYDSRLGRFLQADPFVQAPRDSQSFNRYSYVFNNPMAYTDPSGYFGGKERGNVRTGVAIVISIFLPQALVNAGLTATQAAVVTGAVAGGVQSGNARGAAVGALTAAAFSGIDRAFSVDPNATWGGLSQGAYAARALSYGAAGGVMGVLQGGRFGHSFASAGFGTLLSPMNVDGGDNAFMSGLGAAVAGGTVSAIGGGSFVNGAFTSAFAAAVAGLSAKVDCVDCKGGVGKPVGDRYQLDRTNADWVGKLSVADEDGIMVVRGNLTVSGPGSDYIASDVTSVWGSASGEYEGVKYRSEIKMSAVKKGGDWKVSRWDKKEWMKLNETLCSGVAGARVDSIGGSSLLIPPVDRIWQSAGTPAHEFGHAMGLSHAPRGSGSIMSYDTVRAVTGKDIQNLAGGYR